MDPSVSASGVENGSKSSNIHFVVFIQFMHTDTSWDSVFPAKKKIYIWRGVLVAFMLKIPSLLWPLISTESTTTRLEICKWGLSRNQWLPRRQNIFQIIAWGLQRTLSLWSFLSPVSIRTLSFLLIAPRLDVSPCHPGAISSSPHSGPSLQWQLPILYDSL